jgi:hypothetical protein
MNSEELGRAAILAASRKAFVGLGKAFKLVKLLGALFVALLLAGCAAPTRTGATLDQLNAKIGGPGQGRARIVVIRDKEAGTLIDAGWKVSLDGAVMGDLKSGTFVYRDRRAGPHKLFFWRPGDFSRASIREFVAAPGRTYVFRLEMNDKGKLLYGSAVAGGLAGLLVTSVVADAADKRGVFDFTLLEGAAAKQALTDIHLAPPDAESR